MFRRHATLIACLLCLPGAGSAGTQVYRCTGEDGQVEFRQTPCVQGRQQELEIEDVKTGWEAPAAPMEVKKWSKQTETKSRSPSRDDKKMQEKCLKTQHKLENVNNKLRSGYKASQGANLRRKRDQYEEYLRKLCR